MKDRYVLPEQRMRMRVATGARGAVHVLIEETFPAQTTGGMWTRRAWHRRALCGSLAACVIGGEVCEASDWPTSLRPSAVDISEVTCKRCRERHARMVSRQNGGAS